MGRHFSNFSVRGCEQEAVEAAIMKLEIVPGFLTESKNDWVTIYPVASEAQEESVLIDFGKRLSKHLKSVVISFTVADGDVFTYILHENGKTLDKYNSWPGYNSGPRKPKGGKAKVLMPFCVDSQINEAELEKFLRTADDGDSKCEDLAKFLGIDRQHACNGFNRIQRSMDDALGAADFELRFVEDPHAAAKQAAKDAIAASFNKEHPCLITNEEKMAIMILTDPDPGNSKPEYARQWLNKKGANGRFAKTIKYMNGVQTGAELIIYNVGPPSIGVRILVYGDAFSDGLVNEAIAGTVTADLTDKTEIKFETTSKGKEAVLPDLGYSEMIMFFLLATGLREGQSNLCVDFFPLSDDGETRASYDLTVEVIPNDLF